MRRLLLTLLLLFAWTGRSAAETEISVALVGDILLTDGVLAGRGADYPWGPTAPLLQGADLTMGNLETAVSRSGAPAPGKQYTFRSRPRTLAGTSLRLPGPSCSKPGT